jgi:hypothetical protein
LSAKRSDFDPIATMHKKEGRLSGRLLFYGKICLAHYISELVWTPFSVIVFSDEILR